MVNISVVDGIVVGAVGGACAGVSVWLVQLTATKFREWREKRRVYQWLLENTTKNEGEQYRSTRAIASWTNLTEDRARYICSVHKKIYLSTGPQQNMWSLYERGDRSVYEKRGIRTV